jgi:exosortase/archaeosortase family protein
LTFAATFLAAVAVLATFRATGLERATAEAAGRWTAVVACGALRSTEPGMNVVGNVLSSPHGTVRVAEECSGFELLGLLAAAMIAYPMPFRRRLWGIALLVPFVFVLNVVRVASLSLALEHAPRAFETLHTFVWQGLLILAGLAYWVAWSGLEPTPAD